MTLPDILARHSLTAANANLDMTLPVADFRAILAELRAAVELVALDVAEHAAHERVTAVAAQYRDTKQGFGPIGKAQGEASAARHQHAAAREAWTATHGPATSLTAEITVMRRLCDATLDAEDAATRLAQACSTGDTTKSGALTAAAKRQLDTNHPVLVLRAQEAETAFKDARDAYRKRARP